MKQTMKLEGRSNGCSSISNNVNGPSSRTILLSTLTTIIVHTILLTRVHTISGSGATSINDSDNSTVNNNDVTISKALANYESWLEGMLQEQRLIKRFPEELSALDYIFFGVIILLALEFLNILVKYSGRQGLFIGNHGKKQIPVRGMHLDELRPIDYLFISMNKAATPPFVYFLMRYLFYEDNSVWSLHSATLWNTVGPLPFLYIIYDFFYTILHWSLHIPSVYSYIHKHHHTQKAPSRANVDAVNVHPIEFFLGEYNHLFAVFIWCRCLHQSIHVLCIVLFLLFGGILTALNHTRFDIVYSLSGLVTIFDSKYHDVHHRIPRCNYGQYIMLWDVVFGTFRPYDENDRVNAKNQLDPTTGKSYRFMEAQRSRELSNKHD